MYPDWIATRLSDSAAWLASVAAIVAEIVAAALAAVAATVVVAVALALVAPVSDFVAESVEPASGAVLQSVFVASFAVVDVFARVFVVIPAVGVFLVLVELAVFVTIVGAGLVGSMEFDERLFVPLCFQVEAPTFELEFGHSFFVEHVAGETVFVELVVVGELKFGELVEAAFAEVVVSSV